MPEEKIASWKGNYFCGLCFLFGSILLLMGLRTKNIPEIILGVHGFVVREY